MIEAVLKSFLDEDPRVDVRFGWALENLKAHRAGVSLRSSVALSEVEQPS